MLTYPVDDAWENVADPIFETKGTASLLQPLAHCNASFDGKQDQGLQKDGVAKKGNILTGIKAYIQNPNRVHVL